MKLRSSIRLLNTCQYWIGSIQMVIIIIIIVIVIILSLSLSLLSLVVFEENNKTPGQAQIPGLGKQKSHRTKLIV